MLWYKFVCVLGVFENNIQNLAIIIILLQALFNILKICQKTHIFWDVLWSGLEVLELFLNHYFEWIFFKLVKIICINLGTLRNLWLQNNSHFIWLWEYSLRHNSFTTLLIIEIFEISLFSWDYHEVEGVKCFSLSILPVLVMEIIIVPHKFLIDYFRNDIFLKVESTRNTLWQLNFLSHSNPWLINILLLLLISNNS